MNAVQPSLFAEPRTIQERFERFHAVHPVVYELLKDICLRWVRAGHHQRWAIGGAWEVLRWERRIAGLPDPDEGPWKLNDHMRSRYARLLMQQEPELEGLFEVRRLRAP